MSKQPGFVSVTLLKEHEKEAVYQMVIRFKSPETAAAWRDSADHKAFRRRRRRFTVAVASRFMK